MEKCADVDKRGTRLPEAKGFMESSEVRNWQRYMDEVKKWEDSRLPLVGGCMRKQWLQPCNKVECQGDDKTGDKLCQRWVKVNKFRG